MQANCVLCCIFWVHVAELLSSWSKYWTFDMSMLSCSYSSCWYSCGASHQSITVLKLNHNNFFFFYALSSWDGLWWQLETNKQLQSTASAKGRNEDFINSILGCWLRSKHICFTSALKICSSMHDTCSAIIITICRTSSAWLKGSARSTVSRLDQKISMLTGLNVQHPYGEYLQVVNYGIGGHYEPHFDHATSPSSPVFRLKTGNRMATFMIYVSQNRVLGLFFTSYFSKLIIKSAVTLRALCAVKTLDRSASQLDLNRKPKHSLLFNKDHFLTPGGVFIYLTL